VRQGKGLTATLQEPGKKNFKKQKKRHKTKPKMFKRRGHQYGKRLENMLFYLPQTNQGTGRGDSFYLGKKKRAAPAETCYGRTKPARDLTTSLSSDRIHSMRTAC